MIKIQWQVRDIRDKAILFGWITGLLLLVCLLWGLTTPLQTHYLLRSVNSVFNSNGDPRRLTSHLHQSAPKASLLGHWFAMQNSADQMYVFAFFQDGILLPLGAVVSPDSIVLDVVPLSAHAVRIYNKIPDSVIKMYVNRIEASAAAIRRGRE
ncbi:MAG: hypothetical protein FWB83_06005 [Treponema sp.]|nr:hypothetical protein [Treponema sp.]